MANKYLGAIDPSTDTVLIGGVQVVGQAEDDAIELAKDEAWTETTTGLNNDYSVSINRSSMGTLTLRLLENSPMNAILSTFLGSYVTGDFVRVPFAINRNGGLIGGGFCWVETQPNIIYGRTTKTYEWVLKVDNANIGLAAGLQVADAITA